MPWSSRSISASILAITLALIAIPSIAQQQTSTTSASSSIPDPLALGEQALAHGDYQTAKDFFIAYLKENPDSSAAIFFAGNAALGLRQYDDAASSYQKAIAKQPAMWGAHKNLVIVYAAQNKWPEFDQERKLLQEARDHGSPGLNQDGSDVIDMFYVGPERYIVRTYPKLAGHFKTRYNFTHFGKDGKLDSWISCESDDVDQTSFAKAHPKEAAAGQRSFSLDSYTAPVRSADGKTFSQTHGTLKFYPDGEPSYETVRADVIKALEYKAAPGNPKTAPSKTSVPVTSLPAQH